LRSVIGRDLLPFGKPFLQVSFLHSQGSRALWADARRATGVKAIAGWCLSYSQKVKEHPWFYTLLFIDTAAKTMPTRMLKLHTRTKQTPASNRNFLVCSTCNCGLSDIALQKRSKVDKCDRFYCLSIFATASFWQNNALQVKHWSQAWLITLRKAHWYLDKSWELECTGAKQHDGWTTEAELARQAFSDFFEQLILQN
jgi:hypothetical protein